MYRKPLIGECGISPILAHFGYLERPRYDQCLNVPAFRRRCARFLIVLLSEVRNRGVKLKSLKSPLQHFLAHNVTLPSNTRTENKELLHARTLE